MRHGDPFVRSFVSRTLQRVCHPLLSIVWRWVHEGELLDPHQEFFVVENPASDNAWHKHDLRHDMIPKFLPQSLAHDVLVVSVDTRDYLFS